MQRICSSCQLLGVDFIKKGLIQSLWIHTDSYRKLLNFGQTTLVDLPGGVPAHVIAMMQVHISACSCNCIAY